MIRAVDHDIATGVWPDMTEHGAATDAWPQLYPAVLAADILVIAGPIWLGDNSSVTKRVIERLYACSHLLNDAGQYAYYGRVGGWILGASYRTADDDRPATGSRTERKAPPSRWTTGGWPRRNGCRLAWDYSGRSCRRMRGERR